MSHIFMTFADTAEGKVYATPHHHRLPPFHCFPCSCFRLKWRKLNSQYEKEKIEKRNALKNSLRAYFVTLALPLLNARKTR